MDAVEKRKNVWRLWFVLCLSSFPFYPLSFLLMSLIPLQHTTQTSMPRTRNPSKRSAVDPHLKPLYLYSLSPLSVLVSCLDCPAFCLFVLTVQHKQSCPWRDFFFSCSLYVISTSLSWLCLLSFTVQHTQYKHSCPRRDSNPQLQHAISRRPSS